MNIIEAQKGYKGILAIGDPHLDARVPGFRKDDYPRVILEKMRWALNYAAEEQLLPLVLGDLFHLPRNNPNWLLVEVLQLFDREICYIYGNHDVHENTMTEDDSICVLKEAGRGRMLDEDCLLAVDINERRVFIGGTSWGRPLPENPEGFLSGEERPLVIWMMHHDVIVPGYEDGGRIRPRELAGIDLVINGHIHRHLEDVCKGCTVWLTPGNISRRARSDAAKAHVPAALRVDINARDWSASHIEIPHLPYDEVFHESLIEEVDKELSSSFVVGLAELQARRTQTGEGLKRFLDRNLETFETEVVDEIRKLAREVIGDE